MTECVAAMNNSSKKGYRRKRTAFTNRQLAKMESIFQKNKYPGIGIRETLAASLGVSESRVQVWFQNRRSKFRKKENNTPRSNKTHLDVKGNSSGPTSTAVGVFSWPHIPGDFGNKDRQVPKEHLTEFPSRQNFTHIPPFHSQIPAIVSDNTAAPTICTSLHRAQNRTIAPGFPVVFYGYNGLPVVSTAVVDHPERFSKNELQIRNLQEAESFQFGHSVDEILAAKGLIKVGET